MDHADLVCDLVRDAASHYDSGGRDASPCSGFGRGWVPRQLAFWTARVVGRGAAARRDGRFDDLLLCSCRRVCSRVLYADYFASVRHEQNARVGHSRTRMFRRRASHMHHHVAHILYFSSEQRQPHVLEYDGVCSKFGYCDTGHFVHAITVSIRALHLVIHAWLCVRLFYDLFLLYDDFLEPAVQVYLLRVGLDATASNVWIHLARRRIARRRLRVFRVAQQVALRILSLPFAHSRRGTRNSRR